MGWAENKWSEGVPHMVIGWDCPMQNQHKAWGGNELGILKSIVRAEKTKGKAVEDSAGEVRAAVGPKGCADAEAIGRFWDLCLSTFTGAGTDGGRGSWLTLAQVR